MSHINEFKLCGEISHIFHGNQCVIITVTTGRSRPRVVCFGRQAEVVTSAYKLGMKIALKGFVVNSFSRGQRNFSLFCSEVLSDHEDYRWTENSFTLIGEIAYIEKSGDYVNFQLRIQDGDHIAVVPMSTYATNAAGLEPGDTVLSLGMVVTSVRIKNGERRYYQNLRADKLIPCNACHMTDESLCLI